MCVFFFVLKNITIHSKAIWILPMHWILLRLWAWHFSCLLILSSSKFRKGFQALHFCFLFHSFRQQSSTTWPCGEALRYSRDNIGFGNWRPGFEFWLHYFTGFEVSGKSHTSQKSHLWNQGNNTCFSFYCIEFL